MALFCFSDEPAQPLARSDKYSTEGWRKGGNVFVEETEACRH